MYKYWKSMVPLAHFWIFKFFVPPIMNIFLDEIVVLFDGYRMIVSNSHKNFQSIDLLWVCTLYRFSKTNRTNGRIHSNFFWYFVSYCFGKVLNKFPFCKWYCHAFDVWIQDFLQCLIPFSIWKYIFLRNCFY